MAFVVHVCRPTDAMQHWTVPYAYRKVPYAYGKSLSSIYTCTYIGPFQLYIHHIGQACSQKLNKPWQSFNSKIACGPSKQSDSQTAFASCGQTGPFASFSMWLTYNEAEAHKTERLHELI